MWAVPWHNPVAWKDLRVLSRRWVTSAILSLHVSILAIAAILYLLFSGGSLVAPSEVAQGLFALLAVLQLALIVFTAPVLVAASIFGEVRRRTWDLLVMTHLPASYIVSGKLLANVAVNLLLLIACIPVFGLTFLFDGMSLIEVARVYVVFLTTLVLQTAAALLICVYLREHSFALFICALLSCLLGCLSFFPLSSAFGAGSSFPASLGLGPLSLQPVGLPVWTAYAIAAVPVSVALAATAGVLLASSTASSASNTRGQEG